jgi:hypothetical protein
MVKMLGSSADFLNAGSVAAFPLAEKASLGKKLQESISDS